MNIQTNRKSILIRSACLIIIAFIIFSFTNCEQPFSFSDVLDGTKGVEGSGSSTFADIDYIVESITNSPSSADVNTTISQSFVFRNQGSDAGISDVYWTAYISDNMVLDGDTPVSSGIASAISGSSSSGSFEITGIWPSSGIYYLLVNVSGGGDTDPSNNYLASNQFTIYAPVGEIDYTVSNVSKEYSTVTSGSLCSEHFDLTNGGGTAGIDDITWTAYASTHSSLGIGTDIIIGTDNTLSGLDAHSTYLDISILGNWPGIAGDYYLIIDVEANDETIPDNNTAFNGMFTVKDPPDYSIISPNFLIEGVAGNPLSGTASDYNFIITENADTEGSQQIAWEVFASKDVGIDGSDILLKSGTISALTAGGSSDPISYADASWPAFGTFYYLIIKISAGDDSNFINNSFVSAAITVPELYPEDEVNDDTGPYVDSSTFSDVSNLDNVMQGGTLDLGEMIKVDGNMDGLDGYDTYKFTCGAGVTSLGVTAEWNTASNAINFDLWDQSGDQSVVSEDTQDDIEKTSPPFTVVPGGIYYIGVRFTNETVIDSLYTLIIEGK